MTLIEVMIVAGVMGLLALGGSTIIVDLMRAQNGVSMRTHVETITEEIRNYLSSEAGCLNTFNGLLMTPALNASIASIRDANGTVRYSAGTRYGVPVLQSMTLENYSDVAGTTGDATLNLRMALAGASGVGPQEYTRSIRVRTERGAGNVISRCVATAKMSDGIWQRNAASITDIFYMGDRVGIGTMPTARLDVAGEIRVGNSGANCDVGVEGAMRYDTSTRSIQYCGGTPLRWRPITQGPNVNPVQTGRTSFRCPTGYNLRLMHYNVGNTNNAFWVVCDPIP